MAEPALKQWTDPAFIATVMKSQQSASGAPAAPPPLQASAGKAARADETAPPSSPDARTVLTANGWKAILQHYKGKVKDNGLLGALAAYEKLPHGKYDDRIKALSHVWDLAQALDTTKHQPGIPAVTEYLVTTKITALDQIEVIKKEKKGEPIDPTTTTLQTTEHLPTPSYKLPSGTTGQATIQHEFDNLKHAIERYWGYYRDGLDNFLTTMQFSSEEEAEPHILAQAFTAVGKELLNVATGHMLEKASGGNAKVKSFLTEAFAVVKAGIEGAMSEAERAEKATGERQIVKFVTGMRNGIYDHQEAMVAAVDKSVDAAIRAFDAAAKGDSSHGKPSADGTLIGLAAGVLEGVHNGVAAFGTALPKAQYFQRRFTQAFATTPGTTHGGGGVGMQTGKLYFKLHINPDYTVDESRTSDEWTLVTQSPNPSRIAQSLMDSLDGTALWQVPFGKKIMIEWEEDAVQWHDGWLSFDDNPDSYSLVGIIDGKMGARIWNDQKIRDRVLGTHKVRGTNSDPSY
jgi:hypothetical protein